MWGNNDRKKHILLIDDSNLIHMSVKKTLESEGYVIDSALTAEEAMQILKSKNRIYELIITDVHLPQKDGIYIIETLKKDKDFEEYKHVPVMVLTSDATNTTVRRAIEKGAKDYLNKPFTTKELVRRVKKLLNDDEESLYNILMESLKEEIERARRGNYQLTLLIASRESNIGISIEQVVKDISRHLRKVDTVVELGKSTIALVLPFTNIEGSKVVALKIEKELSGKWYLGYANFPTEASCEEELYKIAKDRINQEINREIEEVEKQKQEKNEQNKSEQ